jgi:hypothetical protein
MEAAQAACQEALLTRYASNGFLHPAGMEAAQAACQEALLATQATAAPELVLHLEIDPARAGIGATGSLEVRDRRLDGGEVRVGGGERKARGEDGVDVRVHLQEQATVCLLCSRIYIVYWNSYSVAELYCIVSICSTYSIMYVLLAPRACQGGMARSKRKPRYILSFEPSPVR